MARSRIKGRRAGNRAAAILTSVIVVKLGLTLILVFYGFVRIEAPLVRVEYGPLRFIVEVSSGTESEFMELPHVSLSFLILMLLELVAAVNVALRAWRGQWTQAGLSAVIVYAINMMVYLNTRQLYRLVASRVVKIRIGDELVFLNLPQIYSAEPVALASLALSILILIAVAYLGLRGEGEESSVESSPYLAIFALLVIVALTLSNTSIQVVPPRVAPPLVSWSGDNSAVIINSRMKGAIIQLVEVYMADTENQYYRLLKLDTAEERVEITLKPILVALYDAGINPKQLYVRTKIYYPDGSVGESIRKLPVPADAKLVHTIEATVEYEFAYTKVVFDPLGCKYVKWVEVNWEGIIKSYAPVRGDACVVVFPTMSLRATFTFHYTGLDGSDKTLSILLTPGVHNVGLRR